MSNSTPSTNSDPWYRRMRGAIDLLQQIHWQAILAGEETIDENLFHYCRALSVTRCRTPEEVAGAIHMALQFPDDHPAFSALSQTVLAHGGGSKDIRTKLQECADRLENQPWGNLWDWAEIAENDIEIHTRFPSLTHLSVCHLEMSDEHVSDILRDYIDLTHPHCTRLLPRLVGEAHTALAAYPTEALLVEAFEHKAPMAAVSGMDWTEWLNYLANTLMQHIRDGHQTD